MANLYRIVFLSAIAGIFLRLILNALTLPHFACLPYNKIALVLLLVLGLSGPPLLMRTQFRRSAIRVVFSLAVATAAFNFQSLGVTKVELCAPTFFG